MRTILLVGMLLFTTACGLEVTGTTPPEDNSDIPGFDKTVFPNEEGKIFGAWQGRMESNGYPIRLFFNRAGYFVIAMKCSGGQWARGAVRATVTQDTVNMLSDMSGVGRDSNGSVACGFSLVAQKFLYKIEGDRLTTSYADGSEKRVYRRKR